MGSLLSLLILTTRHSLEEASHPLRKLLSQNVTAGAVRLRAARFCMLQDHPMRETYKPF